MQSFQNLNKFQFENCSSGSFGSIEDFSVAFCISAFCVKQKKTGEKYLNF